MIRRAKNDFFDSPSIGPHPSATTLYVSTTGSDSTSEPTPCAVGTPCATVQYALAWAYDGDTISIGAGTYTLTTTINPGMRNIVFAGSGVTGANLTRLKETGSAYLFTFDNSKITSSTVVRNLVIQNNTSSYYSIYIPSASPIIEKNVFPTSSQANTIYAGGAATIKNNIIVGGHWSIYGGETTSIINNTVVNTTGGYAFLFGDRTNNIAYANAIGFDYCDASNTNNYEDAFANSTNYSSSCTTGTELNTQDPDFKTNATGASTGLSTTVLTDSGASWEPDQWIGYFVTPDIDRSTYPVYFLITDNDESTLTVIDVDYAMTSYGSLGDTYKITNFMPGVSSNGYVIDRGDNSVAPSDDIYGTPRPYDYGDEGPEGFTTDVGAVEYYLEQPSVTLSILNTPLAENGGVATVTATLSSAYSSDVTVNLAFSGTATLTDDYIRSATQIVISPSNTTGSITITGVDDSLDEDNETVMVDIDSVTNGTESGAQQVTATIADDDATPTLSVSDVAVDEGAGTATVTVTMTGYSGSTVSVNYATSDGTATAGSDYTSKSGSLSWNSGETGDKTFAVTISDDSLDESNETVTVTLTGASNATINDATGTLTINDDDATPTLSVGDVAVAESAGTATVTVTMSGYSGSTVSVHYATSDGTAAAGSDYTSKSGSLSWNSGETGDKTFAVSVTNDSLDESNETVNITLSDVSNATISDGSGVLTITDDDEAPSVTLGLAGSPLAENGGQATVTATLSAQSGQNVTVNLAFSGAATPTTDYTTTSSQIVITPSNTQGQITITGVDDSLDEIDEGVVVDIDSVTNGTESGTQQVTATITDDDSAPTISIDDPSASEGAGSISFTATLSSQSGQTVQVQYATSNGTALAGSDYTSASGTLTFNPGDTQKPISVTVADDSIDEGDETLNVTLSNPTNATISDASGTGTITDNDTAGFTLTGADDLDVTEGSTTDTFTIKLNTEPTDDVEIALSAPGAQVSTSPTSLTFTTVNYSTAQTVTVTAVDDAISEGNHQGTVSLVVTSDDADYDSFDLSDITADITDNDSAGVDVAQTGGSTSVTEGSPDDDTISIVLTSQPTSDVSIWMILNNGKIDLSPSESAPVTFSDENWNVPQIITITADDDHIVEGAHGSTISFTVTSDDGNYDEKPVSTVVSVSIVDDDSAGVSKSTGSLSVTEGGAGTSFTMVLTSEPVNNVSITISHDSQVTVSPTSLTFTAANWNNAQTVTISAVDDDIDENDHPNSTITFSASSSDSAYNNIGISSLLVGITDNDNASVTLSIASADIAEGDDTTYTIVLGSAPTDNVTITMSSSDENVSMSPASVEFAPESWNTAQTVTISVGDNFAADGNRAATISHEATSDDANYNGINISDFAVSILDNDTAGINLTSLSQSISIEEGKSVAAYTIVLGTEPSANVVITPSADGLTFSPTLLTFTPANWNSAQTVTIAATDNDVVSGNLTKTITNTVTSADLDFNGMSVQQVTVTITDNDTEDEGGSSAARTVSCGNIQCIKSDSRPCVIHTSTCSSFSLNDSCAYTWAGIPVSAGSVSAGDGSSLSFITGAGASDNLDFELTAACSDSNTIYQFTVQPVTGNIPIVLIGEQVETMLIDKEVVAASDQRYIAMQSEGKHYDLDLGQDVHLETSTTDGVKVLLIDDFVIVSEPTYQNNRGIIASIDMTSITSDAKIDFSSPDKLPDRGVALFEGAMADAKVGSQLKAVNFNGEKYLAELVPGTTHGSVYIHDVETLDLVYMINGDEIEEIRTDLLITADLNGNSYSDIFVGANSAMSLNGILGDAALPTVMSMDADKDVSIDSPNSMLISDSTTGDYNGDGIEDMVLTAASDCRIIMYTGSQSIVSGAAIAASLESMSGETTPISHIASADFTGDGRDDIAISLAGANNGNGKIYILLGNSFVDSATFSFEDTITVDGTDDDKIGSCLFEGDYNGDGISDLYTCVEGGMTLIIDVYSSVTGVTQERDSMNGFSMGGGGCKILPDDRYISAVQTLSAMAFILLLMVIMRMARSQVGARSRVPHVTPFNKVPRRRRE